MFTVGKRVSGEEELRWTRVGRAAMKVEEAEKIIAKQWRFSGAVVGSSMTALHIQS